MNHLQVILLRPVSTDQILTGVHRVILFRPEAAWKDRVLHQVPLVLQADLPHHIADLPVPYQAVLTLQVLLPPEAVLRHAVAVAVAVALPQEGIN